MKNEEWIKAAAKEAAQEFPRAFNGNLSNLTQLPETLARIIAKHVPATGWQGIETAPKDGREILVYGEGIDDTGPMIEKVSWECHKHAFSSLTKCPSDECSFQWIGVLGCTYGIEFTHWQPLPAPPAPANEKA